MEPKLRVLEEQRSVGCDSHSNILPVTFKSFDRSSDVKLFLPIFWEYWFRVQQEDRSTFIPLETELGVTTIPSIEATLYHMLHDNCKIKLAIENNKIIGFMMYHDIFGSVIAIRGMYVYPEHENKKLAKKLVNSVGNVKRLIFQTRKENEPSRLLDITKDFRVKLKEDDHLITWEMIWQ